MICMRKRVSIIIFALVLITNGCAFSEKPVEQKFENKPAETSSSKEATAAKKDLKAVFNEVVSNDGNYKFKVVCEFADKKASSNLPKADKMVENFVCKAGKLKFSVSSTKSGAAGVRTEFEKLKKETSAAEQKAEGLTFIEYGKSHTTTEKVPNFPEAEETVYQGVWNKIYLINDGWMINFEALCTAHEPEYCKLTFVQTNEAVREFFNSLELIKK